jgi:hypothetical protein
MNNETFTLKTIILKSNHKFYEEKKKKKLNIVERIDSGSYGIVYLLDNNHVIKIFKYSNITNTNTEETSLLIPTLDENRELIFYLKYKNKKEDHNFIIKLFSIGILNDDNIKKKCDVDENAYFVILPFYNSFYKKYNTAGKPLIDTKNGLSFTVCVMKRLLEISLYLEKIYDYIYLDFKLNNFMFSNDSEELNDMVIIDFSLIKKKSTMKQCTFSQKHYTWPTGNNILLENIPSYSICINALELLLGSVIVKKLPDDKIMKEILLKVKIKNKNLYDILLCGLLLKTNTEKMLKLVESFNF